MQYKKMNRSFGRVKKRKDNNLWMNEILNKNKDKSSP